MRLAILSSSLVLTVLFITGCGASGRQASRPIVTDTSSDPSWTPPEDEVRFTSNAPTQSRRTMVAGALPAANRSEIRGQVHAAY
jgi:hypothetical protein